MSFAGWPLSLVTFYSNAQGRNLALFTEYNYTFNFNDQSTISCRAKTYHVISLSATEYHVMIPHGRGALEPKQTSAVLIF
jgi:hypothetical protein